MNGANPPTEKLRSPERMQQAETDGSRAGG